MSKKIATYEELLKKSQELAKSIEIRIKKWTNCATAEEIVVEVKIGATSSSLTAKAKASEVIQRVIETLKVGNFQGVAVFETLFAFGGESVALEIALPNVGRVVFRDVTADSACELVKKYTVNIKEIEAVMMSDGNTCSSCNH